MKIKGKGKGKVYLITGHEVPVMWYCSWLRHRATSRKVAGSIPDGIFGIFH